MRLALCLCILLLGVGARADELGTPLIFSADQLSSNASDQDEGQNIGALLDGDPFSFWHTDWHGRVPDARHYLQVRFEEPFSGSLQLYMLRRNTPSDHPTEMVVEASNDGKNWDEVTKIKLPFEGQLTETYSEPFDLNGTYRYLRVAAINCAGAEGFRIFWHAAEFQIYGTPKQMSTLIDDASQLSSNASDQDEGRNIGALLDDNVGTFWHTDWHNRVQDDYHYLQVDFREPVSGVLALHMVRRQTDNDHPIEMVVEASNDTRDWTYITHVNLPYEGPGTETRSESFNLPMAYRYLRVAATNCTGSSNYGFRKYWHAAEFQIYHEVSAEGLPFIPTRGEKGELLPRTQWYTMSIRGGKMIYTDGKEVLCESDGPITLAHLWAFVGDNEQGFRVYNCAYGTEYWVYVASSENRTYLSMVKETPATGSDRFMVEENTAGGHSFYYPGVPLSCWNDRNGHIGLYNNANSIHDSGSDIYFTPFDVNQLTVFVSQLVMSQTVATVYPGKTLQLSCEVLPEDATKKELQWSSSDPSVASVSPAGLVTAREAGTTVITAMATDGSNVTAVCTITVPDNSALEPYEGEVRYVYLADGRVKAYPKAYIKSQIRSASGFRMTLLNGETLNYGPLEYDSISYSGPQDNPTFTSFKFNNKFNENLIGDAEGKISSKNVIKLEVTSIGKRLTPSFKVSAQDAAVYIGTEMQQSKESRLRFDKEIVYTVAKHGNTVLRRTLTGDYVECPMGTDYKVQVDFKTDHVMTPYGVPVINIKTNDGSMISSKDRYWDATISIDGGGAFPDMEDTPMQIRGRGNSSWAGTWGKSPYRIKFEEKQKVLGLTKGKNWNLIANAQRQSMTSNAVGQRAAQMVQTAAANHEIPVELYINGDYRGSYNLTEKVGFSNNSVDIADETHAVLLELDSYYDEPYKFRTSRYNVPVNIKEPDLSLEGQALTKSDIQTHFNQFTSTLSSGGDISELVDIDYLARYLFVNDLVLNFEFMHPKSTYLYCEDVTNPESKYIWGPVWDLDWGYGYESSSTYFQIEAQRDYWNGHNMEMDQTGFIKKLRYSGEKTNRAYYRVWTDFMENHLTELLEFCDDYYTMAATSFTHDNSKWGSGDAKTYKQVTENAKSWLKTRANYIYGYLSNTLGYAQKDYLVDDEEEAKPTLGDVNEDGAITTADVVCILNYIMGRENDEFEFSQADTDGNELITVADAMYVLNLVGQQQANNVRRMRLPEAGVRMRMVPVTLQPGLTADLPLVVEVERDGEYCGMQFDLHLPQGITLQDVVLPGEWQGYSSKTAELADNTYRISLYASAQDMMPVEASTLHLLLACGDEVPLGLMTLSVTNSLAVSAEGEDERLGACSTQLEMTATGISELADLSIQGGDALHVESNQDGMLRVYSLDGRLVRLCRIPVGKSHLQLPRGVYVVNGQKIIIR